MSDVSLDKMTSEVRWVHDGQPISVRVPYATTAHAYPDCAIVLVLAGEPTALSHLIGLSLGGEMRFIVAPPDGYSFGYLTEHVEICPAIVCGKNVLDEGFPDWHFAVNPESGVLRRHCPAY